MEAHALHVREPNNIYVINPPTHQPHDKFFRTAMSDKRVARDFLKSYLPQDITQIMDWDNLELQPRSYINDVRKESIVDVLYKTMIGNDEAYIYLLVEHQSKPDTLMPFRMLKYIVNIMDDHLKQTKQDKLPLVYPVVVYHADKPYPYSTDIIDIIEAPRLLAEKYFLKPFHLIDLGKIDDEEIKSHTWSGIMKFALKHVFERDLLTWFKKIIDLMRYLASQDGEKYIELVLEYLFEQAETDDIRDAICLINEEISMEMGEKATTIVRTLRSEGRLEGRLEGIEDVARKLLVEKVDLTLISRVTQLSINEIKQLEEKAH